VALPITVRYGGLNINDGTTYTVLDKIDLGERIKTWSEYRGLDGTVAQYNVTEASMIEMRIPLLIKGTSLAAFNGAVAAINNIIDGGPALFAWNDGSGETSFNIGYSPRVHYVLDVSSQNGYYAIVDLILYRTP